MKKQDKILFKITQDLFSVYNKDVITKAGGHSEVTNVQYDYTKDCIVMHGIDGDVTVIMQNNKHKDTFTGKLLIIGHDMTLAEFYNFGIDWKNKNKLTIPFDVVVKYELAQINRITDYIKKTCKDTSKLKEYVNELKTMTDMLK